MTVELIVIGKTDSKEIAALVEMYARRVNFYCKFAYCHRLVNNKLCYLFDFFFSL
jgi:23S rRNA pseudoU1915 N3-methylase RlmH